MIEVIKDKNIWREQIANVKNSDFYYTYDYHQLSANVDETPTLIKYRDGNTILLIPLLIRAIENSGFNDATSVYGYAGPLVVKIDSTFDLAGFHRELNTFFNENKIISVFSRLHPFIKDQEHVLNGLGTI